MLTLWFTFATHPNIFCREKRGLFIYLSFIEVWLIYKVDRWLFRKLYFDHTISLLKCFFFAPLINYKILPSRLWQVLTLNLPSPLLSHVTLPISSVVFCMLFLICVCIYYRFLVCSYHEVSLKKLCQPKTKTCKRFYIRKQFIWKFKNCDLADTDLGNPERMSWGRTRIRGL